MSWLTCLDVIVLALMLGYVLAVIIRSAYVWRLARRTHGLEAAKVIAQLIIDAGRLKSIASAAPCFGLAGASVGALSAVFWGASINMERHTFEVAMASRIAAGLIATTAGILVAIPAACSYNCLWTRINSVKREIPTRRFPLLKRFSQLPAFAAVAAPSLALIVAVYTPFFSPREPTGLDVELASARCELDGDERPLVLRITDEGKLFLNAEQEDWNNLAGVLARIYSTRLPRTLYLVADDGVPFQTVADAVDIVESFPIPSEASASGVRIKLATPAAMNACLLKPVAIRSRGLSPR